MAQVGANIMQKRKDPYHAKRKRSVFLGKNLPTPQLLLSSLFPPVNQVTSPPHTSNPFLSSIYHKMSPSPPRVDIATQGTVEGKLDSSKRVVRFLNIPYATVQERWRPAIKPQPWSGIRDATKQGYVCVIQGRFTDRIGGLSMIFVDLG